MTPNLVTSSKAREHQLMRVGYELFNEWLSGTRSGVLESLDQLEARLREETKAWITLARHRQHRKLPWQFDKDRFPSLFADGIGVFSGNRPLILPFDLRSWDLASVREHVTDPLARFLLAVIWKSGETCRPSRNNRYSSV